ncbi:hypothetical protein LG293_17060 (plasmid) [Citricoccus nitrophenolicus]
MAPQPKLPHISVLRRMRREGMTLRQVGEHFDVTPSAVWHKLNAAGDIPTARTVDEMTGWRISKHHRNCGAMRHLMNHNRLMMGKEVEPKRILALRDWVEDMLGAGVVVDYHPDAPANDASRTGGFYYRKREESDDSFFRRHIDPDS